MPKEGMGAEGEEPRQSAELAGRGDWLALPILEPAVAVVVQEEELLARGGVPGQRGEREATTLEARVGAPRVLLVLLEEVGAERLAMALALLPLLGPEVRELNTLSRRAEPLVQEAEEGARLLMAFPPQRAMEVSMAAAGAERERRSQKA